MKRNRISIIILVLSLAFSLCMPTTALAASKKAVKIKTVKSNIAMFVGKKKTIKPKTNVKVKKITYKVSNKKIAVVKKGKVIAKKAGTVKIRITVYPKSKKYRKTSKTIKIITIKKYKGYYYENWMVDDNGKEIPGTRIYNNGKIVMNEKTGSYTRTDDPVWR